MNSESILRATGRKPEQWYNLIQDAGLSESSHKEIAEYLSGFPEVSFWWAQTLTVEYEKHIGRRVLGQTAGGNFQIGVSRTLNVPLAELWEFLESSEGISLLLGEGTGADGFESLQSGSDRGIEAETTTYHHASHVRMRFRPPGWKEHSILQVRVRQKGPEKTVITFHQEKLPHEESREEMKNRWKEAAARIALRLKA